MEITPNRPSADPMHPLLEEFLGSLGSGRFGHLRPPAADVMEAENEIRLTLEVPGLSTGDIDIEMENNVLTISGEKREERSENDDRSTWHLTERRYGRFSRSFVLPRDVDQDGIRATFDAGVLRIVIPKSEESRRRRIDVQAGSGSRRVEAGG